jgi:6-phosphogluconolactonase
MENIIIADNTEVKIFKNASELHLNAAGYICASIRHFINRRGRCTMVLSGGNTPKMLYDEINNNYKNSVEWDKVYFFWGDERCVPPSSEESNYKMAYEHLLSKLPVVKENIFRIQGEKHPVEAAALYEEAIKIFFDNNSLPSFDIMLLGIGTDGHTASLFPGTKALDIKDKIAVPVYAEEMKSWRITMTFPVINHSNNIIIIAEGKKKSEIINKVFNDKKAALPVQGINAHNGQLTWFIDKEAAGIAFPGSGI